MHVMGERVSTAWKMENGKSLPPAATVTAWPAASGAVSILLSLYRARKRVAGILRRLCPRCIGDGTGVAGPLSQIAATTAGRKHSARIDMKDPSAVKSTIQGGLHWNKQPMLVSLYRDPFRFKDRLVRLGFSAPKLLHDPCHQVFLNELNIFQEQRYVLRVGTAG